MCQAEKPKPSWLGLHNALSNKEQKMYTVSNTVAIPADDPRRNLVVANADNSNAQHLGVVGDTYTILLSGMDTAGRFTLIDMHDPPGGGPAPHRHDSCPVLAYVRMESTLRPFVADLTKRKRARI